MTIIEIEEPELQILYEFAEKKDINPSTNPDLFCEQSANLSKNVPDRLKFLLKTFIENGSDDGFLLFKNIKIENLGETPPGNQYKIGEKTILAKIQAILIHLMGEMIAYEAEGYGRLFQDVVPVRAMEKEQTSIGSNIELEIHTEQAFSKLRPDVLSLACLRGDANAFTYVFPVKRIIENLSNDELILLREPLWETDVDLSFKLNGHEFIEGDVRGPIPIINGTSDDPFLVFDQDLMKGVNNYASEMIDKIIDLYYKKRGSHNLKAGEIIFIDNNRAVHGRSPFLPKYDGMDRFLVRCFATVDYKKSAYARINGSRTVAAIYS
jgi:L-asparagine oxygenase